MFKLRVFVEQLSTLGNLRNIVVSGSEQRQIRANRLKVGDSVELFDRSGTFLAGKIGQITPFTTHINIENPLQTKGQVTHKPYEMILTLAVGLPKGDRTDILIEKITEIGVTHIIPINTKRTVGSINMDNKYARWNRIILQASKQSLCPQVPVLEPALQFPELVTKMPNYDMTVWGCMPPSETDEVHYNPLTIMQLAQNCKTENIKPRNVLAVIGPEGDFTNQEKSSMCDVGGIPLVLSVNRLRTETAAIVLVTNLISTLSE